MSRKRVRPSRASAVAREGLDRTDLRFDLHLDQHLLIDEAGHQNHGRRRAHCVEPLGVHVSVPPLELCTDNAAMIAAAAHYRYLRGERVGLDAEPVANLRLDTE